ncbi:uncharacterized protein LOC120906144 [Anopheles arabiensis]|uniref:Uncharacterized protein n=1 Tax=Anopheles arabiensis TaxID=7173 RepID=A0A182I9U4_ANOAR|nr:uncharacterized protein LOC120906144 [Anopheles arabiensis]
MRQLCRGGSNRTKPFNNARTHGSSSSYESVVDPLSVEMAFRGCCLALSALLLLLIPFAAAHPSTELRRARFNQPAAGSPALRTLGTLGILFGAIEAEAAIERRLERLMRELVESPAGQRERLERTIAETLQRGEIALEILGTGLELAASRQPDASLGYFRRELDARTQEILSTGLTARSGVNPPSHNTSTDAPGHVKRQVDQQLAVMRRQLAVQLKRIVRNLGDSHSVLATNLATSLGSELIQRLLLQALPKPVRFEELVAGGLKHHAESILRRQTRQDEKAPDTNEIAVSVDASPDASESMESEEEEGPGGLVGLIASLSGGDEGSDVGALIGSLSAVVTNLFGPGGLDVPGLLGTGTSLIAGLLGGDDNFGKVLGSYVGIAIEGLSGGGADMNGAFFGNFLGALIAALSSDPEDDNLPLRPKLFVENFFTGLEEAKRKADPNADAEQCCQHKGGSDLFAFIGNIVSSVVGGITSLVLNASLGSSGGSSQGSADASGASSAGSSGSSGDHPGM